MWLDEPLLVFVGYGIQDTTLSESTKKMQPIDQGPQIGSTVYQSIRDAICEGSLKPETRIVQDEIAQQLGVSRQPVHQALQQLRRDGLLVEAGRRGLVVAPLDGTLVLHVYELRAALDGAAAAAAAQRARPADRVRGEQIIRAGRAAVAEGDLGAMASADFAFHDYLYELAGNPLITAAARGNWHHVRRSIMLLGRRQSDLRPFWDAHEVIIGAVIAGDEAEASRLAQKHARASGNVFLAAQNSVDETKVD